MKNSYKYVNICKNNNNIRQYIYLLYIYSRTIINFIKILNKHY